MCRKYQNNNNLPKYLQKNTIPNKNTAQNSQLPSKHNVQQYHSVQHNSSMIDNNLNKTLQFIYINIMCLPCKSNKMRIWSFLQNRMTGYPVKFDEKQVQELRKKFKRISGNRQNIDKQSFQENMGILGLTSVEGFSDRLFNSFDTDRDGKISFQDFVQYMEVLKSGSQKNKAKISFSLIDVKNKNSVNMKEFKQFLDDYFRSWTSITNSIVTPDVKQRTDNYVQRLYSKVRRQTGKDYIDFGYYAQKVFFDQQFLDAFQYITEGVANMFMSNDKVNEDSTVLYKVLKSIRQINAALSNNTQKLSSISSQQQKLGGTSLLKNSQILKNKPVILKQQLPTSPKAQPIAPRGFSKLNIPNVSPYHRSSYNTNTYTNPNTNINTSTSNMKNTNNITLNTQNTFTNNNNISNLNNFTYSNINSNTNYHTNTNTNINNSTFNETHQYQYQNQNQNQNYQCKNCFKLQILQKKIEYLTSKLKKIVQQTKHVYQRLDQKLYDKTSNKKNQTVNNIHVQQKPVQGNMIFFGDDNWNLVLNMMIGIQMAVRSVRGYQQMIYEQPKDFKLKYYFELVPRRFGDNTYLSRICSFTDYAPNTFNHIRRIFNIDNEEYINSIGPNKLMTSLMMGEVTSLSGLTSQGKSGSFFYYTADGKYMLKTIHYGEYKQLREILQDYYYYIKQNPQTLITKFFGLHKLIQKDGQGEVIGKSYFVIMANVFNTKQKIIQRYDIKGSSYGRQTRSDHPNATKKDNDFKKHRKPLQLTPENRLQMMKIIRKDAQFFRQHDIIDYSLLIGIVKKDPHLPPPQKRFSPMKSRESMNIDFSANQLRQSHMYQNIGSNQEYIFGIIDILTEYNTKKAMEYYFKSLIYGKGVSAVPPDDYADRFVRFIDDVVFKKYDEGGLQPKPSTITVRDEVVTRMGQKQNGNLNPNVSKQRQNQNNYEEERRNKLQLASKDSTTSYYFKQKDSHMD